MADLLTIADLPDGFDYPAEFIRVVELGLTELEPWQILEGWLLRDRMKGLRRRYRRRRLVPFARRLDNDDVACFDVKAGDIIIIHDFASPGWEERQHYPHFYDWLRQAVEDLIDSEN